MKMSLFGKIVKTTINIGIGLPVAILKDVVTLGGVCDDQPKPFTSQQLDKIKEEAED